MILPPDAPREEAPAGGGRLGHGGKRWGAGAIGKLDEAVSQSVRNYIAAGLSLSNIGPYVKVSKDSLLDWKKLGEKLLAEAGGRIDKVPSRKRRYAYYVKDIEEGKMLWRSKQQLIIARASAEGDASLAWRILEKEMPEEYGPRETVDMHLSGEHVLTLADIQASVKWARDQEAKEEAERKAREAKKGEARQASERATRTSV